MKAVKVDLGPDINTRTIYTFSDWHIGDKFCNINAIKKLIEEVKTNPNTVVILNGDLCNNATKTSVSDCYAEKLTPMQQINTVCTLLDPIRDRILLATQGNHEYRSYKTDGIDITALITRELGMEDRYAKEGGLLFLRCGTQRDGKKKTNNPDEVRELCYTIYVTHGSGGGRKEGAKAIRLADMASIVDADIYIHSHTHLPMIMKEAFYRTDVRNSTFAKVDKLFVNTAAHLEYGGYGQTFEFKPSSQAAPKIYLSGETKEFTARL